MVQQIDGHLDATGKRFAIIAARWNAIFTDQLIEGALASLRQHGADDEDLSVIRCPGSFELPQVAARVASAMDVDAIICLGVLIRGDTPHFDHICSQTTAGISAVGVDEDIPVAFGVLTCDTMEQAMARSGSKAGNKGQEAALAALEMASLYDALDEVADA